MSFVNPAYLWALSGLLVPIGIHLLSRKEGKVIKVGSLRHVEESNTSRFKSIRLNEIWLLLLRCLMIILLVMFMSGARCSQIPFTTSVKWVLIEKELENNPRVKSQVESLVKTGFEVRYLAKDFPLRDRTTQADDQQNYWQLIEQLNEKIGYDIIVFSQSRLSNFYGKRVELSSFIRWIPVESDENKFIASAVQLGSDSVRVRLGGTSSAETSFTNEVYSFDKNEKWFVLKDIEDSIVVNKRDTLTISIVADEAFANDSRILTAALKTLQKEFNFTLILQPEIDLDADWIFWLRENPFAEVAHAKVLLYQHSLHRPLLEKQSEPVWRLTKQLDQEIVYEEKLLIALYQMLFSSPETERRVNALDKRMLPEKMLSSTTQANATLVDINKAETDVGKYLLLLFLLTWMFERILAFKKNQ